MLMYVKRERYVSLMLICRRVTKKLDWPEEARERMEYSVHVHIECATLLQLTSSW